MGDLEPLNSWQSNFHSSARPGCRHGRCSHDPHRDCPAFSAVPSCAARLIHPALDILRPRRTTRIGIWRRKTRKGERAKRVKGTSLHYKSTQSGTFDILPRFYDILFTIHSIQDALRTFFQPIKNDDARLDFYTMYKEDTEYDINYVKKYDEDLNTTLIFVCFAPSVPVSYLTQPRRWVCSPPSVLLSSSTSTRASNSIRTSNPQLSSAQSSSPSINPPFRARLPSFHPPRRILLPRSSRSPPSCTRESGDPAVCCIRRNVGEAVAQPILAEHRRVDDRALR